MDAANTSPLNKAAPRPAETVLERAKQRAAKQRLLE